MLQNFVCAIDGHLFKATANKHDWAIVPESLALMDAVNTPTNMFLSADPNYITPANITSL